MLNRRLCFQILAVVILAGMLSARCSSIYTPSYIVRVLTKFDASSDDFHWKRSEAIPASSKPTSHEKTSNNIHVTGAFEKYLGQDLVDYLETTGTISLIVSRNGRIEYETYANDATQKDQQPVFSVSKSILSIFIGQAIHSKVLSSREDSVTKYLPELRDRDTRFEDITLGHLLDMRSGIKYNDNVSFPFFTSDPPLIYYADDLKSVVLQKTEIDSSPGEFHYNDFNPNMLALAYERALGKNALDSAGPKLWDAIGAEYSALWSTDKYGFPYWESGLVAVPRDLLNVGQMMLNGGNTINGPVLDLNWHSLSTSVTTHNTQATPDGTVWEYRNGWWIVLRPEPPHDYAAIGRFGQIIYVSPRNNVVIVRTGLDENHPYDDELTQMFFTVSDEIRTSQVIQE